MSIIDHEIITIPFGKYRDTPITNIDPGYLGWMLRKAGEADAWPGLVNFVHQYQDAIRAVIDSQQLLAVQATEVNYTLNPSQQAASDLLAEWLQSDAPAAKLEGGAGYGKSYTVMDVARRAIELGYNVHACATSYVATQVLVQQLAAFKIEPKTIASTLRLEKVFVDSKAEYVWGPDSGEMLVARLSPHRLLIVDEYSMVSDDIGARLLRAAESYGGKLLVVGDLKQLPPVGQHTDSVLSKISVSAELTQPMRYSADSDLYQLEQLARNTPAQVPEQNWSGSTGIHIHASVSDMIERYVEDLMDRPGEDARMLFFRRTDVVQANAVIRAGLYGSERAQHEPVIEDERLMVMATTDIGTTQEDRVRFYSGTSYLVQSVTTGEVEGVPCYIVKLNNGLVVPIMFMVTESKADTAKLGGTDYTARLRAIAEHCEEIGNWKAYHAFKSLFLPVGYNYAMTVHRCQGQTVDRVYFAPAKLAAGRMTNALLYVAATRAKREVHMALPNGG